MARPILTEPGWYALSQVQHFGVRLWLPGVGLLLDDPHATRSNMNAIAKLLRDGLLEETDETVRVTTVGAAALRTPPPVAGSSVYFAVAGRRFQLTTSAWPDQISERRFRNAFKDQLRILANGDPDYFTQFFGGLVARVVDPLWDTIVGAALTLALPEERYVDVDIDLEVTCRTHVVDLDGVTFEPVTAGPLRQTPLSL